MVRYDRLSDYKVDGVVESSKQGTFIGTVDTMPDASTAEGVTVLYIGADSTYTSGTYYTSDGTSWSVATVSQSFQTLVSDVETLTGRVDGITSFEVEVVSALPSTGVAGTIYFTPSTNSQTENVYDEYVYVSSGWEQVGSTTFTLSIVQASSGITINDTALQSATSSVTGLMTASQATELYDHEDRIQTLESDITLLSSSEEVDNLAGRVTTLESTVNSTSTGLATKASASDLSALSSTVSTNTSNIATNTSNIATNTSNIATNTSNIATNTSDISSLKTRVSTAESDIDSLESSVSTLDGTVSTLSTTVAGKQDTVTGAATTIVSSNLTANRALASNSSGKVAVSSVTSTELGYLSGVTSNIQTQINTLTSGTFTVQVVDALPSTGGDTTIYFVPNGSSGDNTHDEYMYVDGTWELIGSTAFTLDVAQDASGISINGTTLQEASATATGLMTSDMVNDIEQKVASVTGTSPISASTTSGAVTVAHSTSGVGTSYASSYLGSTTAVPRLYIDSYGHITGVTTATIYPPTTAGTSGQYWKSDGSGQGVWQTADTTPTSGSTALITSGGVYDAVSNLSATRTASYGACASIAALYSVLVSYSEDAEISLSFSFENANGNDGTIFLTAPVCYSASSSVRIGPGFYSVWTGSDDDEYTLYYLLCTADEITVYYQGRDSVSVSSTTVSEINHCYYSYIR